MLTMALASLPTTPPDALEAIAKSLSGHRQGPATATRLALLANPNTPALDTSSWGTLPVSDVIFALEQPSMTASARAAILATGQTLLRVAARSDLVAAGELADVFATREPTLSEALDLLVAHATPRELAARAASQFRSDSDAVARRISTCIVEAGVARPGLTESVDQYLGARAAQPDLTWLGHLRAQRGSEGGAFLRAMGEVTRDAETARALLADGNIGLAVNPHVDERIRVRAITSEAAHYYTGALTFRHLSDAGALVAIGHLTAEAQNAIAAGVVNNPERSGETLDALFERIYGATRDALSPKRLERFALHPNSSPDLRARVLKHAEDNKWRPTIARMLDPEAILSVSVEGLHVSHASGPFVTHHLVAALGAQGRTVTAEQARVVALLEPTFTGTAGELLAAAAGIGT